MAALCVVLWNVSPADGAINAVFTGTPTPVPCTVQANGVRFCTAAPRSTVKTFDGVPIDVNVAFPPQPASGPDGPYPLIMQFHGYNGTKTVLSGMQSWLDRGYATFSMTTRGMGESCGTAAARAADPSACDRGYVRLMDTRYEVRDAQELAGRLADEGRTSFTQIGAIGGSYGGGMSMALAALKDRKMLPAGSLVPWTSPMGVPMRLAAASPHIPWTDWEAALQPNGSTLDYVADAPYRGRTGVRKQSLENSFFSVPNVYYAPDGFDPDADLWTWHVLVAAGEPYDDSSGVPLPAVADMRDELTMHHSSYYIDHSQPPAPVLISNGWADDIFPADEAIRYYNRTRTEHPGAPVSLFFMDYGHVRAQGKAADRELLTEREEAWFDYYVKGVGSAPSLDVEVLTQTCPGSAPSGGPYFATDWAHLAPGEIRQIFSASQTIVSTAGSQPIADAFDPVGGGGACVKTPGADQPGVATYRTGQVPPGGYTMMGSPTVIADITSPGANSQIAARLLDVDAVGDQTLIARGLWRPAVGTGTTRQVFQLHPNGWRFAEGHVAKLELLPRDSPYGQASNGQANVTVSNLDLRLPVLEQPGALGGLVTGPAAKRVPAGYQLAADFRPQVYVRPKGATPVETSLVVAYQACAAPNRTHGPSLAFPSCGPPQPVSSHLTVGTPDANGKVARFTGSASFDVLAGDPGTAADEADVRLAVALSDVRRKSDLSDYTGELQAVVSARITDRASSSAAEPATVNDIPFRATVTCSTTPDPDTGGTCSLSTTLDSLVPGWVPEGMRSIWELDAVEVFDGGADGLVSTVPNALFARQGLFVP